MEWVQALAAGGLTDEKPIIFKHGPKQICVWKKDGELFAFDNRCPHEGYPLREGALDGNCILTCHWHNWKFNLRDGSNLDGEDSLRTYPVKMEDGFVWLNLTDPPKQRVKAELLAELKRAFADRTYDRIARILAKFHFHGLDPLIAVHAALQWSWNRFEYGFTHAFAVLHDWIELYEAHRENAEVGLAFLAEAIDHMAHDVLRQPEFPFTEARRPFSRKHWLRAIEDEDETAAVAMLNEALDRGLSYRELEEVFYEAALSHYSGFGHVLIYLKKALSLIERFGGECQGPLLKLIIRYMIVATKEDMLPEFRAYHRLLERCACTPPRSEAGESPLEAPLGLATLKVINWTVEALTTHSPREVYAGLLRAVAHNLLCYDTRNQERYDQQVSRNFGWLGVSHALTFANAVRVQAEKCPRFWKPGLLQMACFVGRAAAFLDVSLDGKPWRVPDIDGFHDRIIERLADHGYSDPIYSCHLVKTFTAGWEEAMLLQDSERDFLLAGLHRFLFSPIKGKFVRRTMSQALHLVGKDFAGV